MEGNIRMDIRQIRSEGVGWIHLTKNRNQWRPFVNMVINLLY